MKCILAHEWGMDPPYNIMWKAEIRRKNFFPISLVGNGSFQTPRGHWRISFCLTCFRSGTLQIAQNCMMALSQGSAFKKSNSQYQEGSLTQNHQQKNLVIPIRRTCKFFGTICFYRTFYILKASRSCLLKNRHDIPIVYSDKMKIETRWKMYI